MRKPLVFLSLVVILALTLWVGGNQTANATGPLCSVIAGTSCSMQWETTPCMTDNNCQSSCFCGRVNGQLVWICDLMGNC